MKKSVAMKWVEALRSGKYKQGKATRLKDNKGGFCCLGVLCEISGQGSFRKNIDDEFYFGTAENTGGLSSKVKKWAGINSDLGVSKDGEIKLYELNDRGINHPETGKRERLTFDEIADIIQLNWKDL